MKCHFNKALLEVKSDFGIDDKSLESRIAHGFYDYGENFSTLHQRCKDLINEVKNSPNTQLISVILEGG